MRIGFEASQTKKHQNFRSSYDYNIMRALCQYYPKNRYSFFSDSIDTEENLGLCPDINGKMAFYHSPAIANKLGLKNAWKSLFIGNAFADDKLDIFHSLEPFIRISRPKNAKYIVTVHDLLFLRYPHLYTLSHITLSKQKVAYACSKADKIIAASEQTAHDIVDFLKIPASKITIVYQGVDAKFKEEYDSYILQRVATKYQLPTDYILSVGALESRKNALITLQALNLLKSKLEIPLVLIGKPTAYKNTLVEYIRQHHLQNQVIFLEDVDFNDLPKIYQQSSMFVYPSIFEGFSIPVVEALFSKVPVITSLGSCFAEAGGPNSIYINPNDAHELADAIQRIHNNPTMATKMTIDGIAHSANFEDDKLAADLMQVYTKALQ